MVVLALRDVINVLVGNAIRGLANYLMAESGMKDERVRKSIERYSKQEADTTKSE